jgi:hypothetical protein
VDRQRQLGLLSAFEQHFTVDARYMPEIHELMANGLIRVGWHIEITPKGLAVLEDDMRSPNDD